MKKFDAILFDMDGVLVDSETPFMTLSIAFMKEKYGLEIHFEDFEPFYGKGEEAAIRGVVEKNGGTYLPQMKDECYELYISNALTAVKPPVGVPEMLTKLKGRYPMAVASSADRRKVDTNISVIGVGESVFDAVITGSDIAKKKPDPEIYLKAAAVLGVNPENCLVVEDAVSGVQAGKAAGCTVAAVGGSFGEETLMAAGADYYFETTADITKIL